MQPLNIEYLPIDSLRFSKRNARVHSDKQLDQLAKNPGRNGRAIELDPLYLGTAIRRWQNFSCKTATLIEPEKRSRTPNVAASIRPRAPTATSQRRQP